MGLDPANQSRFSGGTAVQFSGGTDVEFSEFTKIESSTLQFLLWINSHHETSNYRESETQMKWFRFCKIISSPFAYSLRPPSKNIAFAVCYYHDGRSQKNVKSIVLFPTLNRIDMNFQFPVGDLSLIYEFLGL